MFIIEPKNLVLSICRCSTSIYYHSVYLIEQVLNYIRKELMIITQLKPYQNIRIKEHHRHFGPKGRRTNGFRSNVVAPWKAMIPFFSQI